LSNLGVLEDFLNAKDHRKRILEFLAMTASGGAFSGGNL